MCSAIFRRITLIGTTLTLSPGANAGIAGAAAPPEPRRPFPDSMKPRMSCLVTRPLMPVPLISLMSTSCSLAMRRTSGDDRWRRKSSVDGCASSSSASSPASAAAAPDATSGCPAAASGSAGSEPLRSGRLRCARRLAGTANHGDDAVDRDRFAFLDLDVREHAGRRRRESRRRPCRSRSRTAARRDRP